MQTAHGITFGLKGTVSREISSMCELLEHTVEFVDHEKENIHYQLVAHPIDTIYVSGDIFQYSNHETKTQFDKRLFLMYN